MYKEELHGFYSWPNIITVVMLLGQRKIEVHIEFWWGNLLEGGHLEEWEEYKLIILKW
jgi:hypothetical protein